MAKTTPADIEYDHDKPIAKMDTVEFLKYLTVTCHDVAGWPVQGVVLQRLISITRAMEATALEGAELGLPDAENPVDAGLLDEFINIIRQAYIGHTASRIKAEKVARQLLEVLEKHYSAAEAEEFAGEPKQ